MDALNAAYRRGHISIVRILLEHGTDGDALTEVGRTILQRATLQGDAPIVRLLVNAQRGLDGAVLQAASFAGDGVIVRLLLEYGADVDARNGNALHASLSTGHDAIVRLLLDHGADVNARGATHDLTALYMAFSR